MKTTLQTNIDRYMNLKGIKFYSYLLYEIAKIMGMSRNDAKIFAEKEKSNFSKTLKGERPLKYDYIIPLEKIFGIPLAKLLENQPYLEQINKDDIPYLRSFRYYAYKDDPSLYEELDKESTVNGEDVINQSDEFNRYYLDYLIEYNSYNGLRHLVYKHNFRLNPFNPYTYETDEDSCICASLPEQIAKFVIDSNDAEIFNKVYNPFDFFIHYPGYLNIDCVYTKEEFIKAVLNNEEIFDSLFEEKDYPYESLNKGIMPKNGLISDIHCANPMLNLCLNYCLKNVELYDKQAEKIIKYGIKYNQTTIDKLAVPQSECRMDDDGNIFIGWGRYYSNLIYTEIDKSKSNAINELLRKLPRLQKEFGI